MAGTEKHRARQWVSYWNRLAAYLDAHFPEEVCASRAVERFSGAVAEAEMLFDLLERETDKEERAVIVKLAEREIAKATRAHPAAQARLRAYAELIARKADGLPKPPAAG